VLVVAGARRDPVARKVAARWGAALLTERDLSCPGWCHRPGAPRDGAAVVAGQVLPTGAIDGLLNRLPEVQPGDLTHIVLADREYVAQETNAFLLSWLATLPCPVLNRPDPGQDGSLHWLPVQWVRLATRLGIPVLPVSWRIAPDGGAPPSDAQAGGGSAPVSVTVIGRRCAGEVDPVLAGYARRLSRASGLPLLGLTFSGPGPESRLLAADPWPDVSAPPLAEAVRAYLRRRATRNGE
jgi:hypothetical protein